MAGVFRTVTFMVLVLAVVVLAEDHDVGGDSEWSRPTDPQFYTTWATGKTFRVGDELEFEFSAGRHDVAVVTKEGFENCVKEKPIALYTKPPAKIILNTTGPHYFICTFGDHCRFGQKLTVDVVGAGAPTTPGAGGGAAPGAGGATPTTPAGSTTTPAGNAAASLGGATFLVAIVSAFVVFF